MPKRPNPPASASKDRTAKKARIAADDDSASITVKLSVAMNTSAERVSAAASRVVAAAAGVLSPVPPSRKPTNGNNTTTMTPMKTPGAVATSTTSNGSTTSGGGGGNAFLKSLRSNANGTANGTANGPANDEAKKEGSTANGANGSHVIKNESMKSNATTNGVDATTPQNDSSVTSSSSTKEVVVPFPHLPHPDDSKIPSYFTPILVLSLFLFNMASIIFIFSQQSWYNALQMKKNLELDKLYEELATSQDDVNILQERMKRMEEARDLREKLLTDTTDVFNGIFGPMVSGGEGFYLTDGDRKEWLEQFLELKEEGRAERKEFNKNLSKFD
mmetsp:Transcript_15392/g.32569  ORF Transcript_15392/g.32569 Transcript_15392/m.32569 type:complete len:331 (-) Transcript_15392:329-1321(-)